MDQLPASLLVYILQFVRPNDVRNMLVLNKNFNELIEKNWWPLCQLLGYPRIPKYIGSTDQLEEYQYDRDKYLYFSYTNRFNNGYLGNQVATWPNDNIKFSGSWSYDPIYQDYLGSNLMVIRDDKSRCYKFLIDNQANGYFEDHTPRKGKIIKGYLTDNELDGPIEFTQDGYISEYTYSQDVREGPYKKVGFKRDQVYSETGAYHQNKKVGWHKRQYQNGNTDQSLYQEGRLIQKLSTHTKGKLGEYECRNGKIRLGRSSYPNGDRRVTYYSRTSKIEAYAEMYIAALNYTFRGDWTILKLDQTKYYLLDKKHPLYSKWRQYILSEPTYRAIYLWL